MVGGDTISVRKMLFLFAMVRVSLTINPIPVRVSRTGIGANYVSNTYGGDISHVDLRERCPHPP